MSSVSKEYWLGVALTLLPNSWINYKIDDFCQYFVNFVQAKLTHSQIRTHATEVDQIAIL